MNLINHTLKLGKRNLIILSTLNVLVIGFIDYITGVELSVSIFYILPIALCTWFVHKRAGIALAFISSIIWLLADILSSHLYSHPVIPVWNTMVMFGSFYIIVWALSSFKRVVDIENARAIEIQQAMLPKYIPKLPGYDIAVAWRPANHIGGDYYDIIALTENTIGLCVGDVTGHGMPAALLMSNLQAAFRILAMNTHSPHEVCGQLNKFIVNNVLSENFISFFYGIIDAENKIIHYSNAGHPPPIVLRSNGDIRRLSTDGMLFGVTDNYTSKQAALQLKKRDVILLYTDGIIEARNQQGEYFGEEGLINASKPHIHETANDICESIISSLTLYSSNIDHDDTTLLVIVVD